MSSTAIGSLAPDSASSRWLSRRGRPDVAQHREHRGRIGRGDDGADEQRGGAVDVEEQRRRAGGHSPVIATPIGGERQRRHGDDPDIAERGAEAALVEDDHQGSDPRLWATVASERLIQLSPSSPNPHPDEQEEDEAGEPKPLGDPRTDDPEHEEGGSGQHQVVDLELELHDLVLSRGGHG